MRVVTIEAPTQTNHCLLTDGSNMAAYNSWKNGDLIDFIWLQLSPVLLCNQLLVVLQSPHAADLLFSPPVCCRPCDPDLTILQGLPLYILVNMAVTKRICQEPRPPP